MTAPFTVTYTAPDNHFSVAHAVSRRLNPAQARLNAAAEYALILVVALLGIAVATAISALFGIGGRYDPLVVIFGAVTALLIKRWFVQRMARRAIETVNTIIKPDSNISYTFDDKGVRYRSWCHDWFTSWPSISLVEAYDEALVVGEGVNCFVLPRDALTEDVDALAARIKQLWMANK